MKLSCVLLAVAAAACIAGVAATQVKGKYCWGSTNCAGDYCASVTANDGQCIQLAVYSSIMFTNVNKTTGTAVLTTYGTSDCSSALPFNNSGVVTLTNACQVPFPTAVNSYQLTAGAAALAVNSLAMALLASLALLAMMTL